MDNNRWYRRRRENNQCPKCGKPLDREGYYCTTCLEKNRLYTRHIRAFSRSLGLCPVCGKEKLIGQEKQCIICRTKRNFYRKPLTEEQKLRYGEAFKKKQKTIYAQRKSQGLCTRCGKRNAENGRAKCRICLDKDAKEHKKKYYNRPNIKDYRREHNLCYWCGESVFENRKVCLKCLNRCKEQAKNRKKGNNIHWRKDNNAIFKNN